MSRRIAAKWQKAEECRYLTETNRTRISEILEEGIELGPEKLPDGHVIELQPCAHYGKVTLEAQLSRPLGSVFDVFDSCEMCASLGNIGLLKNVRCSLEMGYSLAEHHDTRMHIFKSGKVVMRRAADRNQAMDALKVIQRCLWGTVICPHGNPIIDCVANGCEMHPTAICPCLAWGISTDTYEPESKTPLIKRAKTLETANLFIASLKESDQIVEILKKFSNTSFQSPSIEIQAYGEQIRGMLKEASKHAIDFTIKTTRDEDATLGLILHALIRNLGRIADGLIGLQETVTTNLIQQATQIGFKAYNAFNQGNPDSISDLNLELEHFQTQWEEQSGDPNSIKIASSGFSLAKLSSVILPK